MNHRMLFLLSIIIIVIGVAGIFTQRNSANSVIPAEVGASVPSKKTITIAIARRDLNPHEILEDKDYQIKTVEVDKEQMDARDLSGQGANLNGFLVRNYIANGSSIVPEAIESPDSKTFMLHSLKKNELPYGYIIKPQEAYLLNSLSVGDKVALYIRVAEVEKGKTNQVSLGSDSPNGIFSQGAASNMNKYALSRVASPLSILHIQREDGGKKEDQHIYTSDSSGAVGKIVLRMNQQQLADLRVVEKAGEILIFPAEDSMGNGRKIRMDEVLPQFRSVKELRGGK